MEELSDNVRSAYEEYIKGNPEKAMDMLIPGSKFHMLLSIIHELKNVAGEIPSDLSKKISKFVKNYPWGNEAK
jgi:hypothetical protein